MSQENPAPPMSRKSIRKANRRNREEAEEAARIQAEAVRFQEEARRRTLSPFQRIIPTNRLIPIVLSDADREYGVYAIFDFECAMHDFPSSFPMTIFIPQLEAMLARVFGVTYKILSVYGAGSYSVFVNNLKRANDFVFQDEVEMKFLPNRLSYCDCSNLVTPGPHRTSNYSRASDRACDVLSQAMSAYPTTVGHRDGLTCNILIHYQLHQLDTYRNDKRLVSPSLEFSKFLSLHPRRGEEPVVVSVVLRKALEKSE